MAEWMTTKEAAHILGVSQRHIRRLIESGRLVGQLIGEHGDHGGRGTARWLVSPLSVEWYSQAQEQYRREKSATFSQMNRQRAWARRYAEKIAKQYGTRQAYSEP